MTHSVLIVDDEEFICSALQRTFKKEKFHVLSANSGEEALQLLKHNTIDIIISDQKMPGMTGTQLLSNVKNTHPNISRIILSGHSDTNDLSEAINEASINKFLTKPWDDNDLITTVRTTLKNTSQQNIISPITPLYKTQTPLNYQHYQADLKKDIKNGLLLLNKTHFQAKTDQHLPLTIYHTLWPAFSNFHHDGIINMARQSGYLSELFLWYLININASVSSSTTADRESSAIDIFFEPFTHHSLIKQLILKLLREQTHLIFRVSFEDIAKESFRALLPELYQNNHSLLLNLGKNSIDTRELMTFPIQYIELDSSHYSINNNRLTQKRINMLNGAQSTGIKTILSTPRSKTQHDYAISMGFDYF